MLAEKEKAVQEKMGGTFEIKRAQWKETVAHNPSQVLSLAVYIKIQ